MSKCANCGQVFPPQYKDVKCGCSRRSALPPVPIKAPYGARSHWLEIHQYPVDNWDSWEERSAREFYDEWFKRIPNYGGGCNCTANFQNYTRLFPPDFVSASRFWIGR